MPTVSNSVGHANHFLAYVKRTIVIPRVEAERETIALHGDGGLTFHATRQRHVLKAAKPGDTIWLVGMPRGGGLRLAPSLDAKLRVAESADLLLGRRSERCAPAPESNAGLSRIPMDPEAGRYYPWSDASAPLREIFALSQKRASAAPPKEPRSWQQLVMSMRTTRVLPEGAAAKLGEHAVTLEERLERGRVVFLSYGWSDATPIAAEVVRKLDSHKVASWWDRWSMPRRVAEGRANGGGLRQHLEAAVGAARVGVCIRSARWRESCYARHEYKTMRERAMPVVGDDFEHAYTRGAKLAPEDLEKIERIIEGVLALLGERASITPMAFASFEDKPA